MNFDVDHIFREDNACTYTLISIVSSLNDFHWWEFISNFLVATYNTNRIGRPNWFCLHGLGFASHGFVLTFVN